MIIKFIIFQIRLNNLHIFIINISYRQKEQKHLLFCNIIIKYDIFSCITNFFMEQLSHLVVLSIRIDNYMYDIIC